MADPGSLRRQRRRYRDRSHVFALWGSHQSLAEVLARAGAELHLPDVLYTVGPAPGVAGLRAIVGSDPGPEWTAEAHYLTLPAPVLRFRHVSGHRLEIHRAASYFGEGDYGPVAARKAWGVLGALVRAAFNEGQLLATPAGTGRYLIARSIPGDREWPVLGTETQDFLRATTGQGRVQMFGRVGRFPLVQYDGRLAYGALCAKLPTGEPELDTLNRYAGWFTEARYRVQFAVPKDWDERCACGAAGHRGIGLLPVRDQDRWTWPYTPGETAVAWVDGHELGVAIAHGWRVGICERMIYPTPPYPAATRANGQPTKVGPLDAWAKKLGALRRDPDWAADPITAELVNAGLRAILLFGIGALHGTPRRITHTVTADDAAAGKIPDHATDVLPLGDRFVWTEREPVRWPEMSHPEWTSAIWGRARVALLDHPRPQGRAGMLHVDPTTVVGCFTDSIYLSADPQWPDDGNVGRYRRVWADERALELPLTPTELRARKADR